MQYLVKVEVRVGVCGSEGERVGGGEVGDGGRGS